MLSIHSSVNVDFASEGQIIQPPNVTTGEVAAERNVIYLCCLVVIQTMAIAS
jgi:hypothetical protein